MVNGYRIQKKRKRMKAQVEEDLGGEVFYRKLNGWSDEREKRIFLDREKCVQPAPLSVAHRSRRKEAIWPATPPAAIGGSERSYSPRPMTEHLELGRDSR